MKYEIKLVFVGVFKVATLRVKFQVHKLKLKHLSKLKRAKSKQLRTIIYRFGDVLTLVKYSKTVVH